MILELLKHEGGANMLAARAEEDAINELCAGFLRLGVRAVRVSHASGGINTLRSHWRNLPNVADSIRNRILSNNSPSSDGLEIYMGAYPDPDDKLFYFFAFSWKWL